MFIIPENMEIMMEFPISDSSEKAVEPKELITRKTEFTIKQIQKSLNHIVVGSFARELSIIPTGR